MSPNCSIERLMDIERDVDRVTCRQLVLLAGVKYSGIYRRRKIWILEAHLCEYMRTMRLTDHVKYGVD